MHWRRKLLTEDTYKHLVALTSLCSIAIVPTVVLNALVIYAVATRPRLQTKSNALLSRLAGTDLVAGLVSMPLDIAAKLKVFLGVGPFCTALEKLNLASTIVLFFASLICLVLISVDRYVHTDMSRYVAIPLCRDKEALEVPGHCHKTANNRWRKFGLGSYIVCCNSRDRLGFDKQRKKRLLDILVFMGHHNDHHEFELHGNYRIHVLLYFLRNTASETTPNRACV